METTIKTKLVPISEVETTSRLIDSLELSDTLKFTTVNSFEKRCLSLMEVEFGEVGYERKSDWMRFVNKLNSYDETPIKRMITGDNKSLDWGGAIVSREDIDYSEDGFSVKFKQPAEIVLEKLGDKYIIAEITELKGKITWEWSSRRNAHKELGNYAGICEVFLYDIEIIN